MEQKEKYYNKVLADNCIVPYEVAEWYSNNTIRVKKMKCERNGDTWMLQHPSENEPSVNIRRHKDGKWYDASGVECVPSVEPVRKDIM